MAGVLIAATTIPDGDGGEEPVEDIIVAAPESTTKAAAQPAREEVVIETTIPEPETFDPGECPPEARVCVDLDGERAWLQEKVRSPMILCRLVRVARDMKPHVIPSMFPARSNLMSPLPLTIPHAFSVYFTNQGHAFHEGDPEGDSHGCVRLPEGVAEHFYNELVVLR